MSTISSPPFPSISLFTCCESSLSLPLSCFFFFLTIPSSSSCVPCSLHFILFVYCDASFILPSLIPFCPSCLALLFLPWSLLLSSFHPFTQLLPAFLFIPFSCLDPVISSSFILCLLSSHLILLPHLFLTSSQCKPLILSLFKNNTNQNTWTHKQQLWHANVSPNTYSLPHTHH